MTSIPLPPSGFPERGAPLVNLDVQGLAGASAGTLRNLLGQARQILDMDERVAFSSPSRKASIGGVNAQLLIGGSRQTVALLESMLAEAERLERAAPPPPIPPAALLTSAQAALALGQPIPVVFARRRDDRGGVLLFPPATEAAFETSPQGVWAAYHCVLSQGQMASVAVRQVRQGPCRVGSFSQAYDRRTGAWEPGNRATTQAWQVPEFPVQCGGGGDYQGLSTIEFNHSYPPEADQWSRAWNVFVESGMVIQRGRIIDSVAGPSDNIVDLWLFAKQQGGQYPDELIDFDSLETAAKFIDHYDLRCNAQFSTATDLATDVLPWFLLQERTINGRLGLVPMVRCDAEGIISIDATSPDWVLTDEEVVKDLSVESPDFKTKEDKPIIILWRQQLTPEDVPITRTLYCSSTGNGLEQASTTPGLEIIDLSAWCDDELHAARIGHFYHAKRLRQQSFGTLNLRPGSHTGFLSKGMIVQVQITIRADSEPDYLYNQFYIVENISYAPDGSESVAVAEWPVDAGGRGLLDMAFQYATAPGMVLPHPPAGDCDIAGRAEDDTIPPAQENTNIQPFSEGGSGAFVASGGSASGGNNSGPSGDKDSPPGDEPGDIRDSGPGEPPRDAGGKKSKGGGKPRQYVTGIIIDSVGPPGGLCNATGVAIYNWRYYYSQVGLNPGEVLWQWQGVQSTTFPEIKFAYSVEVDPADPSWPPGTVTVETWTVSYIDTSGNPQLSSVNTLPGFRWEMLDAQCNGDVDPTPVNENVTLEGDTLWKIAEKVLGDPNRWPEIYELNQHRIQDPRWAFPNQGLTMPP
jgi:hypothetical protein